MEQDVLDTFENYLNAFLKSDLNLINSFIEYPITYISDGDVVTLNKFPVNPKEWAEKKGWHTTIDIKTEVHGYNGKTANIISSGKRVKKDRTLIEEYSAFYAFKKIGSEWKMYAVSQAINNEFENYMC